MKTQPEYKNYLTFVTRLTKSSGITIDQIAPFEEWLNCRKQQFEEDGQDFDGQTFEQWLNKRYFA